MGLEIANLKQLPPQTPPENPPPDKKMSNKKYRSKLNIRLIFYIIFVLSVIFIAIGIIASQHREIITNPQAYNAIQITTKASFIILASMIVWFFLWPIISLFIPSSKEQLPTENITKKRQLYKSYAKIFMLTFVALLVFGLFLVMGSSTAGVIVFSQFASLWIIFIIIVRAIIEHMANSKNSSSE